MSATGPGVADAMQLGVAVVLLPLALVVVLRLVRWLIARRAQREI
jgi:hypothetical protein